MSMNVQGVIQALSRAVEVSPTEEQAVHKPVITLSRDHGAGGTEITKMLAERLDLEIYDETVLDAVAHRVEVSPNLLKGLHERSETSAESWLYALITGKNVSREEYLKAMITVMRSIYHKGGIIVGRGAHIVLEDRDVLRVRLTGSEKICAKRIAERKRLTLTEAKEECARINKERGTYVWNMFQTRLNDPANFDLTINTDHFASFEDVLEILIRSMEMIQRTRQSVAAD